MLGLYERDFTELTAEEISEKKKIDAEGSHVSGAKFGRKNFLFKYPEAVRRYMSLFPNNTMDIAQLKNIEVLQRQCDEFEEVLNNKEITELHIKRFIQDKKYYHIPASIFHRFSFGHHEAAIFKEFPLGTSYKADYLLAGRSSGGWQFIYAEFENPYKNVVLANGSLGDTVRKGINQIDDWKTYLEGNYSCIKAEFEKYTKCDLPREFTSFDSSRMHYVVVVGRRTDFQDRENARLLQRRTEQERNIIILHYDNLLDDARELIGANTY